MTFSGRAGTGGTAGTFFQCPGANSSQPASPFNLPNCHSTPKFDHSLQNTLPFNTSMLPFPMFRPRPSNLSLILPAESPIPSFSSFQNLRTFQLSNLPTFRRAIPFRIRTYEKHAPNPFRIRTSKTKHLKPFRMNTYEKKGEGAVIVNQITADQPRYLQKFGRTHQSHSRAFASSFLGVLLDEKSFSKLIPAHEGLRGAESIEQILNFAVLVNLLGRTKYVCRNDLQGV